jgi:hypothetical protein
MGILWSQDEDLTVRSVSKLQLVELWGEFDTQSASSIAAENFGPFCAALAGLFYGRAELSAEHQELLDRARSNDKEGQLEWLSFLVCVRQLMLGEPLAHSLESLVSAAEVDDAASKDQGESDADVERVALERAEVQRIVEQKRALMARRASLRGPPKNVVADNDDY